MMNNLVMNNLGIIIIWGKDQALFLLLALLIARNAITPKTTDTNDQKLPAGIDPIQGVVSRNKLRMNRVTP